MLITLGAAVLMKLKYVFPRGNSYQFRIRVPQRLVAHYGKSDIRKSLNTFDLQEAMRLGEIEARKYQAEFKVLAEGKSVMPQDVAAAGRMLAEKYDNHFEEFIDLVLEPARERHAAGDEETYRHASPSEFLKPEQLHAWQLLAIPMRSSYPMP